MCRLLFLLGTPNKQDKIMRFLVQSIHPASNTPWAQHKYYKNFNKDGFGFTWLSPEGRWKHYKKPCMYLEDRGLADKMPTILASNVIIGHIRSIVFGDREHDNTHPFIHENQVFVHNGFVKDFGKHKAAIKRRIHSRYVNHIRGSTDSELLFYLFLTIRDELECENPAEDPKSDALLLRTMKKFFHELSEHDIELYANFIFADQYHVLITRYILHDSAVKDKYNPIPLPLYYSTTDGIVISSEPVTEEYHLVPANSAVVIGLPPSAAAVGI